MGKVKFDTNLYSTAPMFAKTQIWLKIGVYRIEILDENYKIIQKHKRLYGNKLESMNWIPYLGLIVKRPNSIKNIGLYKQFSSKTQEQLEQYDRSQKKIAFSILAKMAQQTDIATALAAFDVAMEQNIQHPDNIWATFNTLTSNVKVMNDLEFNDSRIPCITPFDINMKQYDLLLSGGDICNN